jgi:hypothetical protein
VQTLTFLHTSLAHVARFSRLATELDASVPICHEVNEELLARAVAAGGVTPEGRAQIEQTVQTLAPQGACVILCTCSTIGGVAEITPVADGVAVLRVDRAMAQEAVASGRRIVGAAALATTIEPTLARLAESQSIGRKRTQLVPLLCEGAWDLFTRNEQLAYAHRAAHS